MQKSAMLKQAGLWDGLIGLAARYPKVSSMAGALGTAAAMDSVTQSIQGESGIPFFSGDWDTRRAIMAAINLASGGRLLSTKATGLPRFATDIAMKDLVISALPLSGSIQNGILNANASAEDAVATLQDAVGALKDAGKVHKDLADAVQSKDVTSSALPWVLGLGGLGALGLGAIALRKYLESKDHEEKGKIKFKLPGSPEDPDSSAEVEMPIEPAPFSDAMVGNLHVGVRRQARKNIKANTRKKDPFSSKLIPLPMWEDKYGEEPLIDEEDEWRADIEKKFGRHVKAASSALPAPPNATQAPPPPAQAPAPPPPPPTPVGGVPMTTPAHGNVPMPKDLHFATVDPSQVAGKIRRAPEKRRLLSGVNSMMS